MKTKSTTRPMSGRRPSARPIPTRLMPTAALIGATGLLLASCGIDGTNSEAAPPPGEASQSNAGAPSPTRGEPTPTPPEKDTIDVDFDALQQVSSSPFEAGRQKALKFVVDGKTGECFADLGIVTCTGTAPADAPDVDMPPLSGRPGAVMIGAPGVAWTIVEGAPPARAELETGQWVNFGTVRCGKPDDGRFVCASDEAAMQIKGAGRDITTQGPLYDAAGLIDGDADRLSTGFLTGTDVLVQGPTMCGAMEGHRLAEVVEGEITCDEAMGVLDEYDERMPSEGTGNAMYVQFDGWVCSSPTYGRSQELQATTVCDHDERGIEVRAPL